MPGLVAPPSPPPARMPPRAASADSRRLADENAMLRHILSRTLRALEELRDLLG